MHSLEAYIKATLACRTEEELSRQFDTFVSSYGIDVCSYHIVAENLRAIPIHVGLVRQNLPDKWVEHYIEQRYFEIDPIIEQSRRESKPFHWFDVGNKVDLTQRQKLYLEELRAMGLTDGLAIPVFGPNGSIVFFGLGTLRGDLNLSKASELELQFACLQTHNRRMDFVGSNAVELPKRLSPREHEVLSLVGTGLSNSLIAKRLGITENTVDTMLRRVFRKLSVNNRLSAVIRGIGLGLILP